MKKYFSIEVLSAIFTVCFAIIYMINDLTVFKAIASICFCVLGFVGFLMLKTFGPVNSFAGKMMFGLIFGMIGDIAIESNFIVGAIFFAIGHMFYIIALFSKEKYTHKDLYIIIPLVIVSVLLINFLPFIEFDNTMYRIVCSLYGVIISIMVAKAICNAVKDKTIENIIIAIGSVLFYISDFVLLINTFSSYGISVLCPLTYYVSQILIAFSLTAYCLANLKVNKSK